MNRTIKKIACWVLALIPFIPIYAQEEQEKQEVSVFGGAGISTIRYSLSSGDYQFKFGGNTGVDYAYFFNDHFGIRSGIEVSFYNSRATIGSLSDSYATNDGQDDFEFRSEISDYEENQRLTLIGIPLMLQVQYPAFCCNGHLLYLALGGKIGFPVSASYETSGATYKTSGYYPQYNAVLTEPVFQGFGTFYGEKQEKNLSLKTAWLLSAEAGMKWMIAESFSLYTGIYCDYGLNSISKTHNKDFLIYNRDNPMDYSTNSVLNAKYTQEGKTESFSDKVQPVAAGLKLRFTFRIPE